MPRVVSFLVLLAILVLVGAVFFRVMAQFMVPLFLACVLLVMFQPLHRWISGKIPRYPRTSALLTTLLIALFVLVPITLLGWNAYVECQKLLASPEGGQESALTEQLHQISEFVAQKYSELTGQELEARELVTKLSQQFGGWAGSWLLSGVQTAFGLLVGLAIMVISLYYFFADGPALVRGLMQLSPLDPEYETELLAKFGEVSRAVVLAIVISAVVQGLAAGIGFYFALPSQAPIFLLTALTMVLAIVPFVGAAGVWVPVCAYIAYYGVGGGVGVEDAAANGGNWPLALGLGIYCAIVVSGLDNVIKPLILHGQSNLHPLLALLSILGGVAVLGPVGILVGPMLVSFLQALLTMFNKEVERWGDSGGRTTKLAAAMSNVADAVEAAANQTIGGQPAAQSGPTNRGSSAASKKKRR